MAVTSSVLSGLGISAAMKRNRPSGAALTMNLFGHRAPACFWASE
ncbi:MULTISPECIES: hypothetical protein [unclassified Mesorhizobium]|nr:MULTISPECIES: hypothetical protein [unclassified Mesorhizobium]